MINKFIRLHLERAITNIAKKNSIDLELAIQTIARDSSAKFILEHFDLAKKFYSREEVLTYASSLISDVNGSICEFGVFQGYTLKLLSMKNPTKKIIGFDSFDGLPENWRPGFLKGEFKTTIPDFSEHNISIFKGLFNETIPQYIESNHEPIALLHVDCDLYESTVSVLEALWSRLAPNAVIVFDEYFNYPEWEKHEHRALAELKNRSNIEFEYIAYNTTGEQVMIQKK